MDDQSIPSCKSSTLVNDLQLLAGSYISERAHVFGVVGAAIIIHNNRVLLLQRACDDEHPNLWEVPGGEAHKDETIVQCAIRELREEAGLHASEVVDMVGEFEWNEDRVEQAQHEQRIWKIFMFLVNVGENSSDSTFDLTPGSTKHICGQQNQTFGRAYVVISNWSGCRPTSRRLSSLQ